MTYRHSQRLPRINALTRGTRLSKAIIWLLLSGNGKTIGANVSDLEGPWTACRRRARGSWTSWLLYGHVLNQINADFWRNNPLFLPVTSTMWQSHVWWQYRYRCVLCVNQFVLINKWRKCEQIQIKIELLRYSTNMARKLMCKRHIKYRDLNAVHDCTRTFCRCRTLRLLEITRSVLGQWSWSQNYIKPPKVCRFAGVQTR